MPFSLLRPVRWPIRPPQMRLRTWLGLIAVSAVMLAYWTQHRQENVPWNKAGGMIGWTETRMVAALGEPKRSIDREFPHPEAQAIRPTPGAGEFRTLFFENVDGLFVAWFKSERGTYTCFRSTWVNRGIYY